MRALNVAARSAVEFQPIQGRRNMHKRLAKFFYIRKQNLCYVLHWQDFCYLKWDNEKLNRASSPTLYVGT